VRASGGRPPARRGGPMWPISARAIGHRRSCCRCRRAAAAAAPKGWPPGRRRLGAARRARPTARRQVSRARFKSPPPARSLSRAEPSRAGALIAIRAHAREIMARLNTHSAPSHNDREPASQPAGQDNWSRALAKLTQGGKTTAAPAQARLHSI